MKDFYEVLGVSRNASEREIDRSYRKLALRFHTDKVGGDGEKMRALNEARETLSDSTKRRDFDQRWSAYQEIDLDNNNVVEINAYLPAGKTPPYSFNFKVQHDLLIEKYKKSPLNKGDLRAKLGPFKSNIYKVSDSTYHDIFTFIQAAANNFYEKISKPSERLTPEFAVNIFINFLSGKYYSTNLAIIKNYLSSEIKRIKSSNATASGILLFEGILEIILMTDAATIKAMSLLNSLKKITDYAKKASNELLMPLIPLFYNKYFRNLHAFALHLYWKTNADLFDTQKLKQFDGYQETKDLLNILKERLSRDSNKSNLAELIRCIKLLLNVEKDLRKLNDSELTANEYREGAFHLLDWVPIFIDKCDKQTIANFFLQIGIQFQRASKFETQPAIKMADEGLALKIFLTAVGIGCHSSPDLEIYINTHVLEYALGFQFDDLMLDEIIQALQTRTLLISNIFPFFEYLRSNISFLRQEDEMIHLMRNLLNAMMNILEYNKTHADGIPIDHSAVTLLYQAVEASLKNWLQETYDPELENKFRLELMDELLFDQGWFFENVEENLISPFIMIKRDEQGWIEPSRSLSYPDDIEVYRTINGAEINYKTGEIQFFLTPWSKERPAHEKRLTLPDVQEQSERNIGAAIFSLDPVDPADKPYHPFNLMRFFPARLCESELLNTMLLTDYMLKFLTTNQEVQGQYPFDQRPVAPMIQHLPEYLRKIFTDYHNESHTGALLRFWIEAEEIDVTLPDKDSPDNNSADNNILRINLGDLKMVVKKHRMARDIHGELKDVGNEDEGWPIYVLTQKQFDDLKQEIWTIDTHAMIFIHGGDKVFYWENIGVVRQHVPKDYRETLIRLYLQPREADGKIKPNTKNMPLLYRITKEMAQQTGLPHRYSPEFIFAHEFTTHYDEIAQYLPEFGRLKELSRLSVLIRYLDNIRQSNLESLQALDHLLNSPSSSGAPDTDSYRECKETYDEVYQKIISLFEDLRRESATVALQKKWRPELSEIKEHLGTVEFNINSPEVEEACKKLYDQMSLDNPYLSYRQIWDGINLNKSDIAKKLSELKQDNYRKQLSELFSALQNSLGNTIFNGLINSFLKGNIEPLENALVNHEKVMILQTLQKQFPHSSNDDIRLAMENGGSKNAGRVAKAEACRQLSVQREHKRIIQAGFEKINLGKDENLDETEGRCFWVPSATRHEVKKDETSGLTRYSFFVYGGVSINPRVNVRRGNGPLGGRPIGGGAFNRTQITKGFDDHHIISNKNKHTKDHELLRLTGLNINSRVNKIYLPNNASLHASRSIHYKKHTDSYSQKVAEKMDKIVHKGKAAGYTQQQYKAETRQMLSEMRQEFRAGNIGLNKHLRPQATKW